MHSQAVATALMRECCGAEVRPGTIDVAWTPVPPRRLRLREARVQAILGVPVARERQAEILVRLDFASEEVDEGLEVTVPPLRRDDVTREVDLIEEVARIDGLERLPATLPARRGAAGMLSRAQRVRRAAEDALTGRGLYEIVGWSFAGPDLLDRLCLPPGDEMRRVVRLVNPISEAQSIMRPTLLGSLLDAARHNVFHNGPDVAIFESGTVYRAASGDLPADEHHALAALMTGALAPRSWRGASAQTDFFAVKALLEALLARLDVAWSVRARPWPFLHPGRSAAVLLDATAGQGTATAVDAASAADEGAPVGFLGELHPLVAAQWDLPAASVFALDLDRVAQASPRVVTYRDLAAVPPLRQDLAVALPAEVPAEQILQAVRAAADELLEEVEVFDVYSGEQVGEGRRSLALALTFRAPTRTLAEADVAPVRERIVAALGKLGGELRG